MRPDMKYARHEISTHHKGNSVYIIFHCDRYEISFILGVSRNKQLIK